MRRGSRQLSRSRKVSEPITRNSSSPPAASAVQRVHRVGRAGAAQLEVRDREAGWPAMASCTIAKRSAAGARSAGRLVRRHRGRHEEHAVDAEGLEDLVGQAADGRKWIGLKDPPRTATRAPTLSPESARRPAR